MSKARAVGKKPRPENEHEKGYTTRRCVEGFATRIRDTQKEGGSVLITIGHDRLEAYATGIEAFLADHDAMEAEHLADMLHCQERVVSLLVALRKIHNICEPYQDDPEAGFIASDVMDIATVAIAAEEAGPAAALAGVSMPELNALLTTLAKEEKEGAPNV